MFRRVTPMGSDYGSNPWPVFDGASKTMATAADAAILSEILLELLEWPRLLEIDRAVPGFPNQSMWVSSGVIMFDSGVARQFTLHGDRHWPSSVASILEYPPDDCD